MSATPTRFTARQEALLSAGVRVVAASGLRGLTHRAVDTEAGLPQGTCSAYMRTRLALLSGLTEYVTAFFADDTAVLAARVEEHLGQEGYAVQQAAEMLRSWLRRPELLLTRMELTIEASRQPAIAEIGRTQWTQLVEVVEHAINASGLDQPRARAVTLIAAVDGILLHALREAPSQRSAYVQESLALLMADLVDESATGQ